MKKLLLGLLILIVPLIFTACGNANENLVKNNMSEITQNYFYGENDDFCLSLSVGKREEPYLLDGVSQNKVDFSLIIFKDKTNLLNKTLIEAQIIIDGKVEDVLLQFNPFSNSYMYDLGYKVDGEIEFEFNEQKIKLDKINFDIDEQKAVEISCKTFENLIENYKNNGKLFAECYLKVLGDKQGGLYWCFTLVGRDNKSFNLILSTIDGKVVASD